MTDTTFRQYEGAKGGDLLAGKSVIVTGAGGGIGRAAALLFAREGAHLTVVDIDEATAHETAELVADVNHCMVVCADTTNEDDIKGLVTSVVRRFGRLDGAFNNAGVEQQFIQLHALSTVEWRRVLSVDLDGLFFCLKHEIEAMQSASGGAIVNTSSALAQVAMTGAAAYIAAKAGVVGLTRAAAVEYAKDRIRVNAVLPGVIRTPIMERLSAEPGAAAMLEPMRMRHAMQRFGRPEEVAQAAVWLLSDRSLFVTGVALPVDGGYLAA